MNEARALWRLRHETCRSRLCAHGAVNRGSEMSFAEACQLEASLFGMVTATDDMREGTRRFSKREKLSSRANKRRRTEVGEGR